VHLCEVDGTFKATETLDKLGYSKVLNFENVPCEIYFNSEKAIVLSLGNIGQNCWLKASKHFYIKAMGTRGENSFYSKLQQTTQLMSYLKHNVPEFQCCLYYIGQLTPRIALENLRALPQLERYRDEHEQISRLLANTEGEADMLEQLELFQQAGIRNPARKDLESALRNNATLRERLTKAESELKGAASIINEWVEKGHAAALLWTASTNIHIGQTKDLSKIIPKVEDELAKINDQNVKSRAHHQDLLLEEVKEPWHMFYAEACGLFHPALRETYKEIPILRELAESTESWMNARLTQPINRTNYAEPESAAVAEAVSAMFRNVPAVEQLPRTVTSRLLRRALKKPIYLGLFATNTNNRQEATKEPYLIDLDDLTGMVLVTGGTGSGKTRVAQIIVEGASTYVPVFIIDPMGEFTGLIHPNKDASKETEFNLPSGRAFEPEIYTLDDEGIRFKANLLLKPEVPEDLLISTAQEVADILSHLMGEERFKDVFREVLLEKWREDQPVTGEGFIDACRPRLRGMKTSIKLDRLLDFKMLMSGEPLDIQDLLRKRLVIFSLNSNLYSEKQKLAVTWFVLRQIHNYFLGQPHSDGTRAVVVIDEVHLEYAPNMPRDAATVLEDMVKRQRARGLAVIMISQSLHDLPGILTQASVRILLRILEGEIQSYTDKFGAELARSLHSVQPRFGYVFHTTENGTEEFYCAFRPTLSSPRGVTDHAEIRTYAAPQKNLQSFLEAETKPEPQESRIQGDETNPPTLLEPSAETKSTPAELSADETLFVQILKEMGSARSRSAIQRKVNWGGSRIMRVIKLLETKRKIERIPLAHRTIIKLLDSQPTCPQKSLSENV
jgi:hypothetical protein